MKSCRASVTVGAWILAFLLGGRLGVAGEVRGDANGDGATSISDSQTILGYLFHGDPVQPACLEQSDVNGDGKLNITDAIYGLNFVFLGGPSPCEGASECATTTVPLEDPTASLEILNASVVGTEAVITVGIVGMPTTRTIVGCSGVISSGSVDILADGGPSGPKDLTGTLDRGFLASSVREHKVVFGCLTDLTEIVPLVPADGLGVLEITACLRKGTPAGDYPLTLEAGELVTASGVALVPSFGGFTLRVPSDVGDAGCGDSADPPPTASPCGGSVDPPDPPDPPEPEESGSFLRGDSNADGTISISDALMTRRYLFNGDLPPTCLDAADANDDGMVNIIDMILTLAHAFLDGPPIPAPYLSVGPDPTADHRIYCEAYDVVAPEETDDLIRLGDAVGAPGDEVQVPVFLANSREVEAFQLVVSYDPSVFTPTESTGGGLIFDGTFYENADAEGAWFKAVRTIGEPSDGLFKVGYIPNLIETGWEVPPGEDRLIFKIGGRIAATAPVGSTVRLEPTNGPEGLGVGELRLRNELTHRGSAKYASFIPRLEGGVLRIVPDVTIFIRGNANDDALVDLSDATAILGYLFLGYAEPRCPDAADVNDSGDIDLSDAVSVLSTLFLGASLIAPPYPHRGEDPTPDALGDCRW